MKRLTERKENGVINVRYATEHETAIHRLAAIEDILGGDYDLDRLRELMEQAPTANVAPVRHGRWEECDYVEPDGHGFGTIRHANAGLKCTNCVHVFKKELLWNDNYCPNCGAKMDGGEENA